MLKMFLIQSIKKLYFTTRNSFTRSLLHMYLLVRYILQDIFSLMDVNYYLKREQSNGCLLSWDITTTAIPARFYFFQRTQRYLAFADDVTMTSKLLIIKEYWNQLTSVSSRYGYYPKTWKHLLLKVTIINVNMSMN